MNIDMNDIQYFQNRIESERKRIARFEGSLNDLELSNTNGIRITKIHLANIYLNCIRLVFSKERSFESMFPDYIKFLKHYKDVCTSDDSMYDIIDTLSIGVLLSDKKNEFIEYLDEILLKYNSDDGMITFLMDYLKGTTSQISASRIKYFDSLLKSDEKAKMLKNELRLWYNNHKDAYWYNSHKSKADTYCGYWSFEIAALAKIFNIDDTILRESQYYPYDLVNYN